MDKYPIKQTKVPKNQKQTLAGVLKSLKICYFILLIANQSVNLITNLAGSVII